MNDKIILIIYNSKRGSTKQYSEWIEKGIKKSCDELNVICKIERKSIKEANLDEIKSYDAVLFGSWLRGSGIVGLEAIKPYVDEIQEKFIIFCTGISDYNPENYAQIAEINFSDKIDMSAAKLYYCPGEYDPAKVHGIDRLMMWVAKLIVIKGTVKEDKSAGDRMKRIIEEGADLKDEKYARQVVKGVMDIIK